MPIATNFDILRASIPRTPGRRTEAETPRPEAAGRSEDPSHQERPRGSEQFVESALTGDGHGLLHILSV